ncbi:MULTISPECIES: biosynthetic-type acetolactate synthase large subunit [Megasphaera]|uniref:Acetolactate synthase n=2 Tax=Megasphaera TaxID=906 RepID=A0ABV1D2C4_9FIRM|nr:biosynthetic-type acetolactate synthase large subunit [Megasphaera sp.]MCH4173708.1 biosynthetic-type acetolactate synthase large subunit [Megasphaera sp.]
MIKMTGARAVLECLKREGVDVVFGYPGGAILPLYEEMYKDNFRHILTGHEQGAVHAADGYARVTGRPGVCIATSGPGVCNMVTGIATANMDSIPMVIISGQVPTGLIGRDSFQEADISGITSPITKHNYLVKNAASIPRVLKEAFYIASTGRPGPVLIDIAKDALEAEIYFQYPDKVHLPGYVVETTGQAYDIDRAVAMIQHSQKPVFLVGGGVILSETTKYLEDIVNTTKIPVVTTLMGKGAIPDSHELHLGMGGMHGSYASNKAISGCDLLIALGARFDERLTSRADTFAPNAQIIHFEIDDVEIDKIIDIDLGIKGDLRWSLPIFAKKLKEGAFDYGAAFADWRHEVLAMKKSHPFATPPRPGCISPQSIFAAVRDITRDDDTVAITDVGQHQMWAAQFFTTDEPKHFISSGGLGTMGFGLPAALGAKVACPEKTVVVFSGDGSILMNCQEFATLSEYGIDVKVIVLHNDTLGMIVQLQDFFYNHHYSQCTLNKRKNLPMLAESLGVKGYAIEKQDDLTPVLKEAFAHKGPALVDIRISPEERVYPTVPGGKALSDMILGGDA